MDENNNYEEKTTTVIKEDCPICDRHPLLKSIFCGLLIFLGAYCAFYTVSDWHFKRVFSRNFGSGMEQRMMRNQMQLLDKMSKPERNPFARQLSANIIHMQQEDDEYKIYIDLRAVDDDADNIQVTSNGNILTISGRSVRSGKNNRQISEFQQNYMFGDNVKLSELKKEIEGRNFIISIPITSDKI